ncbi:hypothetical protein PEX1_089870 [Penicillium expansum]|uniref:Uncharacterized protein n=1 Tax=Penicillium expansum TaxID=27334 RepID=A0A0A2KEW9_PENEN|nr:hypothetical protein PEX2_050730 [Penicillium expansum]KGO48479.1 hypothetical protein PEXP_072080 [Penicillium expansum]KGO55585.1 hypothetical protein PEX2_050730 [Penicillium expansum]KGO65483.1 hypothetical protein PEX1_089870 [Penicillium expansum]
MVYTSDSDEYLQLLQIFQPSSEKHNSHAGTSAMQPPTSAVGQPPPLPSADWPLYDPSISYASTSLDPNCTVHTTIGLPTADNLYQNRMQSSSVMQQRATGVETEVHLSPGRTSTYAWSSPASPFTPGRSPANENNNEVDDVEPISAHSDPQNQELV